MSRSPHHSRRAGSRRVVVQESTGSRVLEQSRVRLLCVGAVFFLCFLSINLRLVEMMIAVHHPLPRMFPQHYPVEAQEPEDEEVTPGEPRIQRGDIVDRNGVLLATSLIVQSAFANPREIYDPSIAAQRLEKAVGVPRDVLLKRLQSRKSFVWIKRHLSPVEQQAVNTLGIPGIYFMPEEERVYPYGNLTAHTVGYVGIDNKGLSGAEEYFDRRLTDESLRGSPLQLSVDVRVQHILRDEVAHAVDEFRAAGGTGVIVDVKSSEVLGMVSLPDFDPHHPSQATDAQRFDRAALGLYEMGSTFKSFTVAMALDAGTVGVKGGYDASGPLHYANYTISDEHSKHRWLSVPEIYAYSSNVGAAKMMLDVGARRQRAFLEKLGMLKPLEIELPERAQPQYPKEWKDISAITIAYGHGISVTPLHLVRGIAALVNGGRLSPLTLLKDGNDGISDSERIISKDTSRMMARLMRLVVKHGTGSKADVPGYLVGGKTGTAEKVQGGGYSKNANMASFVATFPVNDPRYVILVMVDDPKPTKATFGNTTGGWTAAPAVGRIIARMAPLMGMMPDFNPRHDDADKYWVDTEKKPAAPTPKPMLEAMPEPAIERQYVRNAAY